MNLPIQTYNRKDNVVAQISRYSAEEDADDNLGNNQIAEVQRLKGTQYITGTNKQYNLMM